MLVAGLVALTACEALVGIRDKTLSASAEDPSAPCADQPAYLFCDDFDQQADVEAGATWQWDTPQGGASVELVTSEVKTPPRAVQFVAPGAQTASAQLGQPVGVLGSGFRLAFDLYVDEADLSNIAQVGVAQVLARGAQISVNYVLGPGAQCQLLVYDESSQAALVTQTLPMPALRTWTRIVLVYDQALGTSVLEDGSTLASGGIPSRGAPGDTEIIAGVVYVNAPAAGAAIHLYVDDVVMRGQ